MKPSKRRPGDIILTVVRPSPPSPWGGVCEWESLFPPRRIGKFNGNE